VVKSIDVYIRKVLLEPGFVLEPSCNDEGNRLRETGNHFYKDKYRDHFDNLFNSVSDWFKAMWVKIRSIFNSAEIGLV